MSPEDRGAGDRSATRVLMIVNDVDSRPGSFVPWLVLRGVEIDLRIGPTGGVPAPERLGDWDGIILMGGGVMPDAVEEAPWLAGEAELLRAALEADLPVLGVCLGGQLLAQVLGGTVEADSGTPEKGATAIELTPEATDDPVFGGLTSPVSFIQNHVDRITALPDDVVLLATSPACEFQAFRSGRAWGLQFHPEADVDNIRRWDAEKLAGLGFDQGELIAAAEAAAPESRIAAEALFAAWIAVVRES